MVYEILIGIPVNSRNLGGLGRQKTRQKIGGITMVSNL